MANGDLEPDIGRPIHFDDIAGGSAAFHRIATDVQSPAAMDSTILLQAENSARRDALYQAVITLSRSIAGRTDLRDLLSGAAESLRPIVSFDHLGLVLHDATSNVMHGYILNEPCNPVIATLRLPVDEDPAGWVWQNQQPLVISALPSENRWPEFVRQARDFGITTLTLVPLTTGENRLGAFGFSSVAPRVPSPADVAFLERVASEFAVSVEAFLAKQSANRERDRLRTLFEITDALVTKLDRDELFAAISGQISKLIRYDFAMLRLCNESGTLDVYALECGRPGFAEAVKGSMDPVGLPSAEVLATGKPVVARASEIDRYPNPDFRRYVELGTKSICLVPLIARDRVIGTLDLGRVTDENWSADDVEFLLQVAGQLAITVSNSMAYRQLTEIKDRLATEKLYLEDEICLDQNIGNMVGEGPGFQAVV